VKFKGANDQQRRTPFYPHTTLRFQHVTKAFQSNNMPLLVLLVIRN